MNTKLIVGVIILIICCILAFLVPALWMDKNDCKGGICLAPTERRNSMLDWLLGLDWYWWFAAIAALAGIYWFFIK